MAYLLYEVLLDFKSNSVFIDTLDSFNTVNLRFYLLIFTFILRILKFIQYLYAFFIKISKVLMRFNVLFIRFHPQNLMSYFP